MSLKSTLPNALALLSALLALSNAQSARADGSQAVDSLRIRGLQAYSGRSLSVFYVSGREAAIGTSGQSLVTRSIKAGPVRAEIPGSGEVVIPAVSIPRTGFEVANYALLVVHNPGLAAVYIRNADGSTPSDPRIPGGDASSLPESDFAADRVAFVSFARLEQIRAEQGGGSPTTLDFNSLGH